MLSSPTAVSEVKVDLEPAIAPPPWSRMTLVMEAYRTDQCPLESSQESSYTSEADLVPFCPIVVDGVPLAFPIIASKNYVLSQTWDRLGIQALPEGTRFRVTFEVMP